MTTTKRIARGLAAVAIATATLAATATSANAAFSPAGPYTQQGTLQLDYAGQSKQCQFHSTDLVTVFMTSNGSCTGGGYLKIDAWETSSWITGSPTVGFARWWEPDFSPWGEILSMGFVADAVNGDSTTPTKIVLDNTQIGEVYSPQHGLKPLYATGEITITTSTGGLVTIVP